MPDSFDSGLQSDPTNGFEGDPNSRIGCTFDASYDFQPDPGSGLKLLNRTSELGSSPADQSTDRLEQRQWIGLRPGHTFSEESVAENSMEINELKVDWFFEKLKDVMLLSQSIKKFAHLYARERPRDMINFIQTEGNFWAEDFDRTHCHHDLKMVFKVLAFTSCGYPAECIPWLRAFPFLALPIQVQERILMYSTPMHKRGPLVVSDYSSYEVPQTAIRRTKYRLAVSKQMDTWTTYSVSHGNMKYNFNNALICKACAKIIRKLVYKHGVCFQGSPESALAFLHDRWSNRWEIKAIEVHYWYQEAWIPYDYSDGHHVVGPTQPYSWHKLCNILVHQGDHLQNVKLVVDDHFWRIFPWERSLAELLPLQSHSQSFRTKPFLFSHDEDLSKRNLFLRSIARLYGREVKFDLEIMGTNTPIKKQFHNDLLAHLRAMMLKRPKLFSWIVCRRFCFVHASLECTCVWIQDWERCDF